MIVREDIQRTRAVSNGPWTGDELQVDAEALTMAAVEFGDKIAATLGGNADGLAAAWAQGFMSGVRAAREDERNLAALRDER